VSFVITRVMNAPRERVWKAWTDPAELKQWWGPKGFKVHTARVDLRPGGTFHYGMTGPDGSEIWGMFAYQKIEAPRRLVFVTSFSDAAGGLTRHPWSPNWPLKMLSTVTFEEQGGKTTITVEWTPAEGSTDVERKTFDDAKPGMSQGWGGTFEQFETYLNQ
jgi:uncharacterized protein YndB with AHSA1/START domain